MDSTISASTLFTLTKTLNSSSKPAISKLHRHFSNSPLSQTLQKRLCTGRIRCIRNGGFQRFSELISVSSSGKLIPSCYVIGPTTSSSRLACISSSAASFAYGGGDNGFGGGNGGSGCGGDGGSSEGEIKSKSIAGGSEEVSALSPEVIILDVGGMTCGGCAGKVKRILESQPQVASASVNLATETAIVWPVPEAKARQNWQQQIGETLAKHLTNCGFNSNLRGQGAIEGEIPS